MNVQLAVLGLSGGELMLVMVAVLVLFGAKKIPEFAKGLGQGIKEFKKASREVTDEIQRAVEEEPPPPPPRTAVPPAPAPPENTVPASEASLPPKT
jgi:sec-independent protein translocase protein TatA